MRFDIDIDTIAKMPLLTLEIRFLSAGRWETLYRAGHDFQRYGQKVVSKKRYGVKPYKHIKAKHKGNFGVLAQRPAADKKKCPGKRKESS